MNISFNSRDTILLVINLLIYRIFTQIPMTIIKSSNTAAPLSTLLGGAVLIFIIFLISHGLSRHISGNILDTVQSIFGTTGKMVVSLILGIYLILSQTFALCDFSKLISLIAFPTSPMWFVTGFLALGGVFGAAGNVQAIVRLHGVFVPVVIIVFLLLVIFTIFPFVNTDTALDAPQNLSPSINSILPQVTLYGDIILLFLIAPTNESRQNLSKKIGYGGIAALALNTLFILAFTLKIPSSIVQNGQYPLYFLMKEVYFGRFFQRLDAMLLLTCALSAMLYLSLNLKLLGSVLHQGFGLTQNRTITSVLGIIVFCIALNQWIFPGNTLTSLILVFGIGGLAILIITAIFVKVRRLLNEKN